MTGMTMLEWSRVAMTTCSRLTHWVQDEKKLIENKSRGENKERNLSNMHKSGRYAEIQNLTAVFQRVEGKLPQKISKFCHWIHFEQFDKEMSWFTAVQPCSNVLYRQSDSWISLPPSLPRFGAQRLASHSEACFQPPLSRDHGGNLARSETCSGGSSRSSRRAALKGEPGCAGRASLRKCLNAGPVYWNPWQLHHFYELLWPDFIDHRANWWSFKIISEYFVRLGNIWD